MMVNWIMAALVSATTIVGGGEGSYEKAYHRAQVENKPLVILVGADWCHACRVMKADTIEPMRAEGMLEDVIYAHVDKDAEPELAAKLMSGNTLPQLVVYTKGTDGWKRLSATGLQSRTRVRDIIRRAIDFLPVPKG
jgi:thiol:disulfide interchange protein